MIVQLLTQIYEKDFFTLQLFLLKFFELILQPRQLYAAFFYNFCTKKIEQLTDTIGSKCRIKKAPKNW